MCNFYYLSFQVDGNDDIIVGVSSDSTICVWNRKSGDLRGYIYSKALRYTVLGSEKKISVAQNCEI